MLKQSKKMDPIFPIPINEPYKVVIERRYEAQAPQRDVIQVTTTPDLARDAFIKFLTESISLVKTTLKRVDDKYPELLK